MILIHVRLIKRNRGTPRWALKGKKRIHDFFAQCCTIYNRGLISGGGGFYEKYMLPTLNILLKEDVRHSTLEKAKLFTLYTYILRRRSILSPGGEGAGY